MDQKKFDKLKPPTVQKKYTVKVDKKIRKEQKIVWVNQPPQKPAGRPKAKDIIPNQIGVTGAQAKADDTPLKAWELFFTPDMIQTMIVETNKNILEKKALLPQSTAERCHFKETSEIEIRGLITTVVEIHSVSGKNQSVCSFQLK